MNIQQTQNLKRNENFDDFFILITTFLNIFINFYLILVFVLSYDRKMYSECFSHIPYAHNNKYTHLPQNEKFCVKKKSGTINFKISELYSRIIFEKNAYENMHFAFGDSQLLGIDWDETKNSNMIYNVY